jgi:hypothetical protein
VTSQEWKQRSVERILKVVWKAGKIRIRDLKRATNYNRGPGDEGVDLWYEALNYLEKRKLVVVGRKRLYGVEGDDDYGPPEFVMTPQAATSSQLEKSAP